MTLCKIFSLTFLFLAHIFNVFTQESPPALLIDEFARLECEDVIARQDNLFAELQQNPNATGYAIIFSDDEFQKVARQTEAMFNGQTEFRRFDDDRFQVIRVAGPRGLKVQLWLVPAGGGYPEI